MLPPMLPTRPWPQTLLLIALALLIAAATLMLACGPVAQPTPEDGDTFAIAPTPTPELDCLQAPDLPGGEVCIELPPAKSLPKYPALGNLSKYAEAAETAPATAGASGTSGQSGAEMPNVFVRISTENKSSTDALVLWLESKGVNRFSNWAEGDPGRISSFRDDYIYAYVPPSLLVPLSQQEGIISINDGCRTSIIC